MFPRELPDSRLLQSLSKTTPTSRRESFRAEMLFASTSIPTDAEKNRGAACIISFKTSQNIAAFGLYDV
jgi:hypothetical protein